MTNGKLIAICISPKAGEPMRCVPSAEALTGRGLLGDRYCLAGGSWSKGIIGKRQITLINAASLVGTDFTHEDSRRNLLIGGNIDLMEMIGREFRIGPTVVLRGIKHCEPCDRPSDLCGKPGFKHRVPIGGLVAEIVLVF